MLIRREYFGDLLWSHPAEAYFISSSDNGQLALSKALENRELGKNWDNAISDRLRVQLQSLGMSNNIRVVDRAKTGRLSAPLDLYFDFTWVCNLQNTCGEAFCYAKDRLGKTAYPSEKISMLLQECHDLGIMRIHIAGGEPTADLKRLALTTSVANNLGLTVSITTNGTLLRRSVVDQILASNPYSITVSLDGPNRETNDSIRGPGVFDRATAGIWHLVEMRSKMGSKTKICVKPVFDHSTPVEWFWKFIDLCDKLGVDELKLNNPERCTINERGHYGKNKLGYYSQLRTIKKVCDEYSGVLKIAHVPNPAVSCTKIGLPDLPGCIGGQELLAVNPTGQVTPCLMNNRSLGNINNFSSFAELIDSSDQFESFLRSLHLPSDCTDCKLTAYCRGGSQTRKIVEYGNYEGKKDPLCPKDFLESEGSNLPSPTKEENDFADFQKINIAHSL